MLFNIMSSLFYINILNNIDIIVITRTHRTEKGVVGIES